MHQARRRLAFGRGLPGATVLGLCVSFGLSSAFVACGDPPLYQRPEPDGGAVPDAAATGGRGGTGGAGTGGKAGAAGGAAAGAGGAVSSGGRGGSAGGTAGAGASSTGGSSTGGASGGGGYGGGGSAGGAAAGGAVATGGVASGGRGGISGSAGMGGDAGKGGGAGNGGSTGGSAGNGGSAGAGGGGPGGAGGNGGAGGSSFPSGVLLHYAFNETSGTALHDDSGAAADGTLMGASFAAGVEGNAASFRGTTDYAVVPGVASALTDMTVAFWVNVAANNNWQRVIDFGNGATTGAWYVTPNATTGTGTSFLRFYISKTDYMSAQTLDGPALPLKTWKHVAVTLASTGVTLYVDGVSVGSSPAITLRPKDLGKTPNNWLGRSQTATDPYFNGQIDDLYIFGRALSAAEIQRLMAGN